MFQLFKGRVRSAELLADAKATRAEEEGQGVVQNLPMPELFERVARILLNWMCPDAPAAGFAESLFASYSLEAWLRMLLGEKGVLAWRSEEPDLPTLADVQQFLASYGKRGRGAKPFGAVVALVYIDRLRLQGVELSPLNWRPILLVALISAHKMYEDVYMTNRPFSGLLPQSSLADVSALERVFLRAVDYRLNVTATEYARYHYAVQSLPQRDEASDAEELRQRMSKLAKSKRRARRRARKAAKLPNNTMIFLTSCVLSLFGDVEPIVRMKFTPAR